MKITRFIIDNALHSLAIEFSTNKNITEAQLSFEYLRISSAASPASKVKAGQVISHKKNVLLTHIESVAKHGYRLIFDDGHSVIFSEAYLQTLALEYESRWQDYLGELKISGQSREAMIDIKQL